MRRFLSDAVVSGLDCTIEDDVIPDDSLTIRQMFERYGATGELPSNREGVDDNDLDNPLPHDIDLTDVPSKYTDYEQVPEHLSEDRQSSPNTDAVPRDPSEGAPGQQSEQ